jgi:hypothetical protein
MAAQLRGIGVISWLYYFLYYIYTPIDKFKSVDMRLGRRNFAVILLPALALSYYLPTYAMLDWRDFAIREKILFVWQLFPIWFAALCWLLPKFIKDTTDEDKFTAPTSDLPIIETAMGILISLSAASWIRTALKAGTALKFYGLFIPSQLTLNTQDFTTFTSDFFKVDELGLFFATFLWLGYLFWDLKSAGMVEESWLNLVAHLVGATIVMGPGATSGMGWMWRERVLATVRHKDAITAESSKTANGSAVQQSVDGAETEKEANEST